MSVASGVGEAWRLDGPCLFEQQLLQAALRGLALATEAVAGRRPPRR